MSQSPRPRVRQAAPVAPVAQAVADMSHRCNSSQGREARQWEARQWEARQWEELQLEELQKRSPLRSSNPPIMVAGNQAERCLNIRNKHTGATMLAANNSKLATNNLDIHSKANIHNKANIHSNILNSNTAVFHPKTTATVPRHMPRNKAIHLQIYQLQVLMELTHKCILHHLRRIYPRKAPMVFMGNPQ